MKVPQSKKCRFQETHFSRFARPLVRYPKGGYGRMPRDSAKRVKSSKARSEGYGVSGTQGVPAF